MKRTPILDPKCIGLASYGKKPSVELDDDTIFFPCTNHILQLTIDEENYFLRSSSAKISEIYEQYKEKINAAENCELFYDTPFHDVTYEYNKDDGKWYLVDQGIGYEN